MGCCMKSLCQNIKFSLGYIYKISPLYVFLNIVKASLTVFLTIFNVLFIRYLVQEFEALNFDLGRILYLCFIFFLVGIIYSGFDAWIEYLMSPIIHDKIHIYILNEIYQKSTNRNVECFDDSEYYENYYYAIQYGEAYILKVFQTILGFFASLCIVSSLLSILLGYNSRIIAIILISVAIESLIQMRLSKKSYHLNMKLMKPNRRINYVNRIYYLKEYTNELRLYNGMKHLMDDELKKNHQLKKKTIKREGSRMLFLDSLRSLIQNGSDSIIMFILAVMTLMKEISIGDYMVLFNGAKNVSNQILQMLDIYPSLYECNLYIEKYRKFLDDEKYELKKGNKTCNEKIHSICFKDVSYQYPSMKDACLKNIEMTFRLNTHTVIVGENGAGKSTIIKLLCGLYYPSKGKVLYEGITTEEIEKTSFNSHIAIVFQNFQVYALTIAENVLMRACRNKEDEELVWKALEAVGLKDKICQFPNTINSYLTAEFEEEGINLSGGEIQRLAIARAYAKKSDILLMDEPSSALDPLAEHEIYQIIEKLKKDKIVISVSHRLTNITKADYIYYLEDGKVTEEGNHEKLVAMNGKYAKMYNLQLKKYS